MGMEALAKGETAPPGVRRAGGATPALAHQPATSAVAVIDTGIDLANPELDAVSGVNCVKPGTPAQDDNGHGTNVAGIIAARNTGSGVVGVAPGTRVYAVKVLNNRSVGTLSQFLCGINWVAANAAALNIRTANMSIGGVGLSDGACGTKSGDSEHKAICAATAAGVTFVVSAGNGGTRLQDHRPGRLPRGPDRDRDHRHRRAPRRARPGLLRQEGARRPHGHLLELRGLGGRRRAHRRRPRHLRHLGRPRRQALHLHRHQPGRPARRGRRRALPRLRRAPRPVRRARARGRDRARARRRHGGDDARQRLPRRPAAPAGRQGLRAAGHRRAVLGPAGALRSPGDRGLALACPPCRRS